MRDRPNVDHVFTQSKSETGSYAFHAYLWTMLGITIGVTLTIIGGAILSHVSGG